MAQQPLTLETLGELDEGTAGAVINRVIREAINDLDDRGTDEIKRKICIEVELLQKNGLVSMTCAAQAKLPPRRSHATVATVGHIAGEVNLLFQPEVRENPRQNPLPMKPAGDGDEDETEE